MPTEACEIDRRIVNKAERLAEAGYDGILTFKDYGKSGLHLRVRGNRAVWLVKFRQSTKTIGQLFPQPAERPITSVGKARTIAAEVRSILKSQPENFEAYMKFRDRFNDHKKAVEQLVQPPEGWSLRKCFEVTKSEKRSENARKHIRASTERDIDYIMKLPAWGSILEREVTQLKQGDIETVRNAARARNGVSTAQKLVSYTRSSLTWCATHHSGASGLTNILPWWLMLSTPEVVQPKKRKPQIAEIVASLILAESYIDRQLPQRSSNKYGVHPYTLGALWWAVLTLQRTGAAFQLTKSDLVPFCPEGSDQAWFMASWHEDLVKGKQRFDLPIPQRAIDHVEGFLHRKPKYTEAQLLLPSAQCLTKPVTGSGAFQILSRLAGKRRDRTTAKRSGPRSEKHDSWPDLLKEDGITWWSPHDVRRTLADFLSVQGYPGGASALLSHAIKDPMIAGFTQSDQALFNRMKQSPARVTAQSYGAHSPYLQLKLDAMDLWVNAVLNEYDRQKTMTTKERRNHLKKVKANAK